MFNPSFVVGLHLDYESAMVSLAMLNLKSEHQEECAKKLKVNGESCFPMAIAYHPKKGILIGVPAMTTEGVTERHIGFASSGSDYQKHLADFIGYIFEELSASNYGITIDNTLVVTNFPSPRFMPLVSIDDAFFRNIPNIPQAIVVSEPYALLAECIVSEYIRLAERRFLVIQLKSQSTEFFFLEQDNILSELQPNLLFSFETNVGYTAIDNLILKYLLNKQQRKHEIIPFLKRSSVLRNRCKLACQNVREYVFNNPDAVRFVDVDIIPDELEFFGRVTNDQIDEILGLPLSSLRGMEDILEESFTHLPERSWVEELKGQLTQARNASEKLGKLPDIVLLTGDASEIISFVDPACKSIFPKSKIIRSPEPEYSVSYGLAYLGRNFVLSKSPEIFSGEYQHKEVFYMNNFEFVVGFDLGHGETALTMVNLKSQHNNEPAVKINVKGESNFITAIAYHPQKGILIGKPAITKEGVTESHLAFKQRPNSDSTYQKILADYVGYIFQEVKAASYGITDKNTLFVIGCPTDWANEKNRNLITTYEAILRNKAKIPFIKVVAESRGALMNAIGSNLTKIDELRGRALVIDLGSSTADFTLINLAQRHADPFDFGHDLGSSLIDKMIFKHILYQQKRKNEIIHILTTSSVLRNRCELKCREAKEEWFNNPDAVYRVDVDIIPDELEFNGRVTTELMQMILGSSFEELRDMETVYGKSFAFLPKATWEDELKGQLTQARNASEKIGTLPDIVLLTGGASKMSFVKPACESIFPKSKIICSPEPEYAISRGLSYWGRVDVRTQAFSQGIDKFVEDNIRPEVTKNVGALYGAIADRIANGVTRIIKNEFDGWKSRRYITINGMKNGIDREVKNWIDSQLNKEVGACIAESVVKISRALEEQVTSLERQFDIRSKQLSMSFAADGLGKMDLRIDVPQDDDYTDGVGDTMATFIGAVAGIMTAVVTYTVTPTVLAVIVVVISYISTALASALYAILTTHPVGWAILAGIGIVSLFAADEATIAINAKLPGWDLPGWVRNMVKTDSIRKKIDSRRSEISTKVSAALSQNSELHDKIVETMTETFKERLKKSADDARVLIS